MNSSSKAALGILKVCDCWQDDILRKEGNILKKFED